MMFNKYQLASLLIVVALFTVPSLALPGSYESSCYRAELYYEGKLYGMTRLVVGGGESLLEIEIEDFIISGEYEVLLFKDYYSNFVAGYIEIDEDMDGKAIFNIPYIDPDFQVIIEKDNIELTTGDWIECEKPSKSFTMKVSPSTLNLKSNGNWVTVKIWIDSTNEVSEFTLNLNGETLEPETVKVQDGHIILKFSRKELQELCEEGLNQVTLSFKIGDETIELSNLISAIHEEDVETYINNQGKGKAKSNNGKAKGKNKNK